MACWSSENATKAYLRAVKMGKRGKEPDSAEFISALAAGNNAQLMVMVSSTRAAVEDASMTVALVAAAHQTGGRVVHVSPGPDESRASRDALGAHGRRVEFVVGKARTLLLNELRGADFVLLDCRGDDPRGAFEAVREGGGGIVVGYNALQEGALWSGLRGHFLPIGEGLMVTRIAKGAKFSSRIGSGSGSGGCCRKKSRWVVTVDDSTGEEHVFRIVSPQQKRIEA